ncbi:MAG: hypothetical protein ACYST3_09720 [Planctomycetota bacterium]|jgi:hypothetical protein
MKLNIKTRFWEQSIIFILLAVQLQFAANARIINMSGEVKVRLGVNENWQPARLNLLLEDIDTIWTGEDGTTILELDNGQQFKLSANSMLDIADLKKLDEQELFLILMKMKLGKIEIKKEKTPLRLGTVSVVHGTLKDSSELPISPAMLALVEPLKNGIRDLFKQSYYPNTILKIEKFYNQYSDIQDCGEFQYYLGHSFESIGQPGQAADAYNNVVEGKEEECHQTQWAKLANQGMERINNLNQTNTKNWSRKNENSKK